MQSLQSHPISQRWPASDPNVLQLYSFPTPNGVKVSIALEEMRIAYEPHLVNINEDQHTPEFLSLNPNKTMTYLERCLKRPGVKNALKVPAHA